MQESFISHRNYLWFWTILGLTLGMIAWYLLDNPVGGRSGSTYFGYGSGIFSAIAILILMWFGIRKRSYSAHIVSLKGWLAFHIWLGLSLLIVVPLHADFEFGCNLHSMAFYFLAFVVISGILGTYFYRVLPLETISNRGAGAITKRKQDLESLTAQLQKDFDNQPPEYGSILRSLDKDSDQFCMFKCFANNEFDQAQAAQALSKIPDSNRLPAMEIISRMAKKRELQSGLRKESRVLFWLKAWLFVHIPCSIVLVVLVLIHIFSIFYFR